MLDAAALICAGAPLVFFGVFYFVLPAYVSLLPVASADNLIAAAFVTSCLLCLASTFYSVVNAFKGRWPAVVAVAVNAVSIWSVVRNYL
jgi:hypothetical protein